MEVPDEILLGTIDDLAKTYKHAEHFKLTSTVSAAQVTLGLTFRTPLPMGREHCNAAPQCNRGRMNNQYGCDQQIV